MSVNKETNAVNLHHRGTILTHKAEIPSIINTLYKIIIPREVYDTNVSNFYDDCHVESFNLEFAFFVKHNLDELEHLTFITKWTSNIDKTAYKKQ